MIRNIKSPSQTDLVFIHCHLNPPGASQTKITLLSLVTLKYNLKFCMKAAAAGLLALKTSIRSCVERSVNIPQSTRPGLTLSPCQCAGVHCLQCADISPHLLQVARPGWVVVFLSTIHMETWATPWRQHSLSTSTWSLLLNKWILYCLSFSDFADQIELQKG